MKRQILCLSGWGQKFNSCENIFSSNSSCDLSSYQIKSLNYSKFSNLVDFFDSVKSENAEIILGWSLGGQLALRLIEQEIIKPKLLILIAPPFQMIKDSRIQAGMSRATFEEFYDNFKKAPDATLKKFSILTAMNDKNAKEIAQNLDIDKNNFDNLVFWLEELERFSFFDFNFNKTPKTLYFHGFGDMIVHVSQMEYFKKNIKDFSPFIFQNCGHAPHLSDLTRMQEIICNII